MESINSLCRKVHKSASGKSLASNKAACLQVARFSVKVFTASHLQSSLGTRKLFFWITQNPVHDARANIRPEKLGQMTGVPNHAKV